MNKYLKKLLKIILGIFFLLILYITIGWVLAQIQIDEENSAKDELAIYIKTNGVHTDIVVPAITPSRNWTENLLYSDVISADSTFKYIGIGWGDKGFYLETPTWADLKASVAFKAAFGLSSTAMHITYYRSMVQDETCKKILISNEQYDRLISYIDNSFQKETNGSYINIKTKAVYGKNDAFYEAKGKYSLFKTCNSWANSALKASGQKAALWTAFDSGIFSKYE